VIAALPDQPCTELGKATISDDQQNMVACLYDGSHNLVWKGLVQPGPATSANVIADKVLSPHEPGSASPSSRARWRGWYAGGNAGIAETNSTAEYQSGSPTDYNAYGGSLGLVGGYNWVRQDGLFYGAETDINWMSNTETLSPQFNEASKSAWEGYSTIRGRIGIAFDPALVFLTGGLALADIENKSFGTYYPFYPNPAIPYSYSNSGIHVGWTAGAGAEFALTNNISWSAQYLRLEIPQDTSTYTNVETGDRFKTLYDNSANILRVGVNWHFD
jgi:outer membrane immunogenic protein